MDANPRAGLVRATNCFDEYVGWPQRCDVTELAIDPVADDLHPRRTGTAGPNCLCSCGIGQLRRLELERVPTDVPPGAREVAAGVHDARQVRFVVEQVVGF